MKTIYIKTTEACNLDCPHCYTSGSKGKKVFWDVNKVKAWLKDYIETLPKTEEIHFELHGGEPFVSKTEDLHDFIDFVRSYGERMSVGLTSNLVFKLTEDRMGVIKRLDGIGTSWDEKGRFKTEQDLNLWRENVKTIKEATDVPFTCNVSMQSGLLKHKPDHLVMQFMHMGFDKLRFEKITLSGNAIVNRDIVPTNKAVNDFLCDLHVYLKKYPDVRKRIHIVNMEEIYLKFENRIMDAGTYFRKCESNVLTINADGNISGCPNDAPEIKYGVLSDKVETSLTSNKRIFQIAKEATLNDKCYECKLVNHCGGGCYKLHWDETGCPTPQKIFFDLLKKE